MRVDKIFKRVKVRIPKVWDESKRSIKSEVQSGASMILYKIIEDADIAAGDEMTVDVKVLIERK